MIKIIDMELLFADHRKYDLFHIQRLKNAGGVLRINMFCVDFFSPFGN